jgi:hypothetical protein
MGRTTLYKALPPGALAAPGIEVRTVFRGCPRNRSSPICAGSQFPLRNRPRWGAPALLDPHPLSGCGGRTGRIKPLAYAKGACSLGQDCHPGIRMTTRPAKKRKSAFLSFQTTPRESLKGNWSFLPCFPQDAQRRADSHGSARPWGVFRALQGLCQVPFFQPHQVRAAALARRIGVMSASWPADASLRWLPSLPQGHAHGRVP